MRRRLALFSLTALFASTAACGPSTPEEYAKKICEDAGAAAFSKSAGVTKDADKYLKEARDLESQFKTKFASDAAALKKYEELMEKCRKENGLKDAF